MTLFNRSGCAALGAIAVILGVLRTVHAGGVSETAVHRQPLTAAAAFETARLMKSTASVSEDNPDGAVAISPNGRRYVARIVRGDVRRNGVWIEVLSGRRDSLASASSPRVVGRLFTAGRGSGVNDIGSNLDTIDSPSPIHWLDEDYIAFLFSDEAGVRQVVGVDLSTNQIEFLTNHPTHVVSFDAKRSGLVFYNAQAAIKTVSSEEMFRTGYAVPWSTDAYSLLQGDISGVGLIDRTLDSEWYVQDADGPPQKVIVGNKRVTNDNRHRVYLSPNSRYALLNTNVTAVPSHWERYTDKFLQDALRSLRDDDRPLIGRAVHQLNIVDLQQGTSRPLWDAPILASLYAASWSRDGRQLLVAPVFLPLPNAGAAGRSGNAAAVVDVATGSYQALPVEFERYGVGALRWLNDAEVEIVERERDEPSVVAFRKTARGWARSVPRTDASAVRTELRQSLSTPPILMAIDKATSLETKIVDPNPQLTEVYSLGSVEKISGKLASGPTWDGLLFYPVGYSRDRAYPLVIQSVYTGKVGEAFTLYGDQELGLGPTWMGPYAAQVLANRGIAVVHLKVNAPLQVPEEASWRMEAFEQVAERLAGSGLVDPDRVGLSGFSRNGYYVEYALTHSTFAFAAAIAADNWDPSYFLQTLLGYPGGAEEVSGGPPFGDGLEAWRQHAPGFNADKIRTPLWKVAQTGGRFSVLAGWEIFTRLRYLQRPVEFYVMPDAERFGSHNTQNPTQLLAVQEGSVDWFDFWLNGREDPDPKKAAQFQRWRHLRELHRNGTNAAMSRVEARSGSH